MAFVAWVALVSVALISVAWVTLVVEVRSTRLGLSQWWVLGVAMDQRGCLPSVPGLDQPIYRAFEGYPPVIDWVAPQSA